MSPSPRPWPAAVPFLVFLSGALALVYEVLWMRQLTVLFGATTLATTATLSGFFLGLAAGSAVIGARAGRTRRPLLLFGMMEVGVGAGALLVPPLFEGCRLVYPFLYSRLGSLPVSFALLELLLAMLSIGLPAFAMGGTLPALAQAASGAGRGFGVRMSGLYALNVLGATLGALAAPFVLLPRLGATGSYGLAVAGSLAVGAAACVIGARWPPVDLAGPAMATASAPRGRLALAALSGAATLGLQVLWTRAFALVHQNSVYSFVLVVVVFLAGLAGGAAAARRTLARFPARKTLAWAWAAGGLLVMASPRLIHQVTGGLAYLGDDSLFSHLLPLALLTMLPATVALGMALPLLIDEAGGGAARVGRLLAANTLGAIAGPFAATFLVAPAVGLWWSVTLVGAVVALSAMRGALSSRGQLLVTAAVLVVAGLAWPGALPPVRVGAGERLLWVREGSHGATAVLEDAQDRWITVNNSYVLGGTATAAEERFQAHLPLLLHPRPRRVVFLGLGTGITAGAALEHPIERATAVEIVPEVVAAARAHFAEANARLLDDPRVSVVTEDARSYLAAAPRDVDVVVGDLLVPWRPAEAALYTREHFASVRRALAADGLFCQWLPLYQLSDEQLAILVRTFVDVFPTTTVWRGNFIPEEPTLALIGHTSASGLDAAAVEARLGALPADGESPFLAHPAGFWLFFIGPAGPPVLTTERRHTDGQPWIELLGLRTRAAERMTGVRLQSFYERVGTSSPSGTPLASIGPTRLAWRDTGNALARASLEGEERLLALLRTLPPELQRSLEVGD